MSETTRCPCCGRIYDALDAVRWVQGMWIDRETGQEYPLICSNCHHNDRCRRKTVDD